MNRVLSVGTRWALLYTSVTLVSLSVLVCFIYVAVERQIDRDARLLVESYLAEVRAEVEAHPETPVEAVDRFTARLSRITPELDYGAAFVAADGSSNFRVGSLARMASSDLSRASGLSIRRANADGGVGAGYLVARVPFKEGELEAAISNRSFAGETDRIRRVMLVSAPLALGLSALCGAWLARRSLRPIARMTRSAQRISGENLSERIPTRGTSDELDQLAITLNGMFDRIATAMERLRGFSADAAHQLKSPIATLRNRIEFCLQDTDLDDASRRLLEAILDQVNELGECVGAMLRLARSDSGLTRDQAVTIDLIRLLDGVATLLQPLAEERGIELTLSAGTPVEVVGDVTWLRELFANLVQNAIAHTGAEGRVTIAVEPTRDAVEVLVTDTGEGIPKAEQERIFDRFHRLSSDRGVPGSGLGLALAQQIAIAHGGTIRVESDPGCGATFGVQLPCHDAPKHGQRERRRSRSAPPCDVVGKELDSWAANSADSATRARGQPALLRDFT